MSYISDAPGKPGGKGITAMSGLAISSPPVPNCRGIPKTEARYRGCGHVACPDPGRPSRSRLRYAAVPS